MPKKSSLSGQIVVAPNAKPLSLDLIARIFFGMPLDRLIDDIKKNPGGKYDDLYRESGAEP